MRPCRGTAPRPGLAHRQTFVRDALNRLGALTQAFRAALATVAICSRTRTNALPGVSLRLVSREVWSAQGEPTVNLSSRVFHQSTRPRPAPASLLGADHPLVRDVEQLALLLNQLSVALAVLVGGVAALYEGASAAVAVIIAAGIALLLLACRAAVLIESRRVHVLDLISEGGADLPIPAVERMCVRLRHARHRRRLVRSIDALLENGTGAFDLVTAPWRFMRADLIATVRHELTAIGALLSDDRASLQGIAMMERLVSDGTSTLHGRNPRLLRDDLRRIRFVLETCVSGTLLSQARSRVTSSSSSVRIGP
jgi:hypothetical protein